MHFKRLLLFPTRVNIQSVALDVQELSTAKRTDLPPVGLEIAYVLQKDLIHIANQSAPETRIAGSWTSLVSVIRVLVPADIVENIQNAEDNVIGHHIVESQFPPGVVLAFVGVCTKEGIHIVKE